MKQGELMWLPADIALLQFDEAGNVKKHKMTERPMNVFLVKKHDSTYWNILYEGIQWCVPKNLLYPTKETE